MSTHPPVTPYWVLHPFHAFVLGGVLPLFLGSLLSDYAYWTAFDVQWSNFASWLLIGAMVHTTLALLCGIVGLVRHRHGLLYVLLLAAIWILGFFNCLHHARDAWAVMPAGLVMSAILTVLALVATWIGFSTLRIRGAR